MTSKNINQTKEIWKPVVGFENRYLVSNKGNVFSLFTYKNLQPSIAGGYKSIVLTFRNKQTFKLVHSMVLEAFVSPRPNGMQARHLNGKRTDNRLENLVWGTPLENAQDKFVHGTARFGERAGKAVLTEKQVIRILKVYKRGCRKNGSFALAAKYGVTRANIISILANKSWKHIPREENSK